MRRHRTWRLIRIQTVCYSDSGLSKKIEENANFRNLADDILADNKIPSMQRVMHSSRGRLIFIKHDSPSWVLIKVVLKQILLETSIQRIHFICYFSKLSFFNEYGIHTVQNNVIFKTLSLYSAMLLTKWQTEKIFL